MAIAEIKQLSVAFEVANQWVKPIDQINFSIKPGKTLAILGESGSGKTMTALSCMRLLAGEFYFSQESKILFNELDLLTLSEKRMQSIRGRHIAMVFQEPMTALNPVLTIGQQIEEVLKFHQSYSKKQARARSIALLTEVEMTQPELRVNQYPHQLSGGQKQRVVIAIAIASQPDILIADEPTTALDVTVQAQILKLLKKLQQSYQMSILLITHDISVVKQMADDVCVMYAGQIVEKARADEFIKHPLHPYSIQLLNAIPSLSKRGQALPSIVGSVPNLTSMPKGCRFHPRCKYCFEVCTQTEPLLQMMSDNKEVRCHLYPDLSDRLNRVELEHEMVQQSIKRTEPTQPPWLSVENLTVTFKIKNHWLKRSETISAVNNLSFHLYPGETLAIVGESGCGKTTTAKAIIQLLPTYEGKILYQGEDIKYLSHKDLANFRKQVQMVFQDPFSSMNPRMTIGEILEEAMQMLKLSRRDRFIKQKMLLDQVNMPVTSLNRYPHQFSGGQRQRICIARALATEPQILVCDEPTSALDISVQAQLLNLLKHLQQEFNLAYLFITHNMRVVSYMADKIIVMRQGQIIEEGPCNDIFLNPKQKYTKQLIDMGSDSIDQF